MQLRQVGSSSIYESEDGNYTQLDASNPSAPVVRTSGGTQLSFIPVTINSEFRCVQVKDRNGNFLSATYDTTNGHPLTVTDTLGRVITFVYDTNNNLQAISQIWAAWRAIGLLSHMVKSMCSQVSAGACWLTGRTITTPLC